MRDIAINGSSSSSSVVILVLPLFVATRFLLDETARLSLLSLYAIHGIYYTWTRKGLRGPFFSNWKIYPILNPSSLWVHFWRG